MGPAFLRSGQDPRKPAKCRASLETSMSTPAEIIDVPNTNPDGEFWDSHPELTRLRRFARAKGASPWGVLGSCLTRALVSTPPTLQLPGIIYGPTSANPFLALVAPSGGGKTGTETVSRMYVTFEDEPKATQLGSAQGLTQAFLEPNGLSGMDFRWVRNDVLGAMYHVDEVQQLKALMGSGAQLGPTLRTAWSGGQLGAKNANPKNDRLVEAQSYRLALAVNVQPKRSSVLFDEAGSGLPQRFLWLPTVDPTLVLPEADERVWARSQPPRVVCLDPDMQGEAEVCAEAWDEIEVAHFARQSGRGGEELDGHLLLCRLKTALGLALLLDGEPQVTEERWQQSGVAMETSNRTRREAADGAIWDRMERGWRSAEVSAAREEGLGAAREEVRYLRISALVLHHLEQSEGRRMSKNDLDKVLNSRDRWILGDTVNRLKVEGKVREEGAIGRNGKMATFFYLP